MEEDDTTEFTVEKIETQSTAATQSSSNTNSHNLSSREAIAFSHVLGEITPMLKRFDQGVMIFTRLCRDKLYQEISSQFKNEMCQLQSTLQQLIKTKVSELKIKFKSWEESFLSNNSHMPTVDDISRNCVMADIDLRINIGENILNDLTISFQ